MHSPKDISEPGPKTELKSFKVGDHVRCPDGTTGIVTEMSERQIKVNGGRSYPARGCKIVSDDEAA